MIHFLRTTESAKRTRRNWEDELHSGDNVVLSVRRLASPGRQSSNVTTDLGFGDGEGDEFLSAVKQKPSAKKMVGTEELTREFQADTCYECAR